MDEADCFVIGAFGFANAQLGQMGVVLSVAMATFIGHFHEYLQGLGILHSFYFGRVVEEKGLAAVLDHTELCKLRRLGP